VGNAPLGATVILDPSVLFTDEAMGWLDDPDLRPHLAVSRTLWEHLGDPDIGELLMFWGVERSRSQIGRVRDALELIERFSSEDEPLDEGPRAIREAILSIDGPAVVMEVIADEWTFLVSRSLAVLGQRARATLHAMVRAGAQVYEVARETMESVLDAVQDHLPPGMRNLIKGIGTFPHNRLAKLVVFGGEFAAVAITGVGFPFVITGFHQGIAVLAGDP